MADNFLTVEEVDALLAPIHPEKLTDAERAKAWMDVYEENYPADFDNFLSGAEVDALLASVINEGFSDEPQKDTHKSDLDHANYMIGYWTGVRDTIAKNIK